MRIIGLTGGIATGKSTVSRYLMGKDIPVLDGDLLSRQLTSSDGAALGPIKAAFGGHVFFPDGRLNRAALGKIIFSDPDKRSLLDHIIRPLLKELIVQGIRRCEQEGHALCVLDMALLFEADLHELCSDIWCTMCPESLQISRIIRRDGLTREEAHQRISSQMPICEKAARSTSVILTHLPWHSVAFRIQSLLERSLTPCTERSGAHYV
mgnify:FL=1